jgi:hypothetical protein
VSEAPKRVIKCSCLRVLVHIEGDPATIPTIVRTGVDDDPDRPARGQLNQFGRVRYSGAHDSWRATCSGKACGKAWTFTRSEVEAAKGVELVAGHQIGQPVGS